MSLLSLPVEICIHVACFLGEHDLTTLVRVLPRLKRHTKAESFCPWRRRRASFNQIVQNSLSEDGRNKSTLNKVLSKLLEELGFRENRQLQVEDIFNLLENNSNGPQFLRLQRILNTGEKEINVDVVQQVFGSRFAPTKVIEAMLPTTGSGDGTTQIYIWLTAYLFYTSLTPKDVIHELSYQRCSLFNKRSCIYVDPLVLVEYFSFLSLFLRVQDMDQQMRNPVGDNGIYVHEFLADTGRSALSRQALFILDKRLQNYLDLFFSSNIHCIPLPNTHHTVNLASQKATACKTKPIKRRLTLTTEQYQFVKTDIRRGDLYKIRAYAGSGKSSCCIEYARGRPDLKILYVAYNKAAKLDADEKFRECVNVSCRTAHGVARGVLKVVNPVVARRLDCLESPSSSQDLSGIPSQSYSSAQDSSIIIGTIDPRSVDIALNLSPEVITSVFKHVPNTSRTRVRGQPINMRGRSTNTNSQKSSTISRIIIAAINNFCWSSDVEIMAHHFPVALIQKKGMDIHIMMTLTQKIWKLIISGSFPIITHDCYLKMLSMDDSVHVNKSAFGQYDIIMFDEAQDANSSICQMILRQTSHCGVIVLGDPYQRIYGFRGAKNECFDDVKFPPTRTFHLTQSFRFGPGIAQVANCLLRSIGESVPLQGVAHSLHSEPEWKYGDLPGVFGPTRSADYTSTTADPIIESSVRYTMIFSKNSTLIAHCLKYSTRYPDQNICIKASSTNPPTKIFAFLHEAHGLYHNIFKPKHRSLRQFHTFQDIKVWWQAYADSEGDLSDEIDYFLISIVIDMEKLIAEAPNFSQILYACERSLVATEDEADIVLTTTHQAKGLEWDHVVISDEFTVPMISIVENRSSQWAQQNISLLYVACTRAKQRLVLSRKVAELVAAYMGSFRVFTSTSEGKRQCRSCLGIGPQNSYIQGVLSEKGENQSLAHIEDLEQPGTLLGYESIIPACDLSQVTWRYKEEESIQPADLSGSVKIDPIACSNCILAWHFLDPESSSMDLVRFAAYIRRRSLPTLTISEAMKVIGEQYRILSARSRKDDGQSVPWKNSWVWSLDFELGWPFRQTWSDMVSAVFAEENKYYDNDLDEYFSNDGSLLMF